MNWSSTLPSSHDGIIPNTTTTPSPDLLNAVFIPHLLKVGILSAILTVICVATIVGNLLVILAVLLVPKLQRPENLLIISLAIADELVGVAVMPIAMIYEVVEYWPFGSVICNLWISLDTASCSASILSLCVISLDRYLVITRPFQYGPKRTLCRMVSAAVSVWILSFIVSIPPLFYFGNQTGDNLCLISQDPVYQIYATLTAFYIPVFLMCIAYGKIYQAAARISKEEQQNYAVIQPMRQDSIRTSTSTSSSSRAKKTQSLPRRLVGILLPMTLNNPTAAHHVNHNGSISHQPQHHHHHPHDPLNQQRRNTTRSSCNTTVTVVAATSSFHSRELKAFKTLTAIVVAFLVSWLPFFLLALIRPFYPNSLIPKWVSGLTLWLGYCNSTINPVLYSIFNKDFRRPFSELLKCRCRSLRKIMRTESYENQYGMGVMQQSRSPRSESPEMMNEIIRPQSHAAKFYVSKDGDTYFGEEL